MSDWFYVGYLEKAPKALAAFVRVRVAAAIVAAAAIGSAAALLQAPFEPGTYEFGVVRDVEGTFYATPFPLLRLKEGVSLPVVSFAKFGAPASMSALDGKRVRLRGSLVWKEGVSIFELADADAATDLGAAPAGEQRGPAEALGHVSLKGEVIDPKCYFGAMRPARGKVHRACAIRCLSGGIPPGLRVVREDGSEEVFLLAGQPGKRLEFDPELAGLTVTAGGTAEVQDGLAILRVESVETVR